MRCPRIVWTGMLGVLLVYFVNKYVNNNHNRNCRKCVTGQRAAGSGQRAGGAAAGGRWVTRMISRRARHAGWRGTARHGSGRKRPTQTISNSLRNQSQLHVTRAKLEALHSKIQTYLSFIPVVVWLGSFRHTLLSISAACRGVLRAGLRAVAGQHLSLHLKQ